VFCSSVVSCFLNDLDMVPDSPVITAITFAFTFHIRCIIIIIIIIIIIYVWLFVYSTYFSLWKQNERGAA